MSFEFKKKFKLFFTFLIFFISFLLFEKETFSANNKSIPNEYVECGGTSKPEWHSLRPYQASPCEVPIKEEEQSLLCGKDFVVRKTFTIINPKSITSGCKLKDNSNNSYTCTINDSFEAYVDAFYSELPIAGNTELIPRERAIPLFEEEKRLADWIGHLPPDPTRFDNLQDYYRAYQGWRGRTCLVFEIPIVNKEVMFCFNNPAKPDYWAALFPYIPYSSTEDRIGKITMSDFGVISEEDLKVENLETTWKDKSKDPRNENTRPNEAVLFFPHLEETAELSTLLQSTFVAKENLNNKEAQSIKRGDVEDVKQRGGCTILESRYNPGDQLFGEQTKIGEKSSGIPSATVKYKVAFDCNPSENGTCTKTVEFVSQIETHTPLIDEIWSKTTAGNSSIFRRIFPKTGPMSPYEKIKDIPVSSKVEYDVDGADLGTQNPELYFPHLGGIYDYFLQGTQTALRPKGFPGSPAGLGKNQAIPEQDRVNEYLSWYLNGTLFRAENDPLSYKDKEDIKRLTTLSGPLNKLLPQEIQWRNKINSDVLNSQREEDQQTGRVDQVKKEGKTRHNQIVACTKAIKLLGFIPDWFPVIGGGIEIGGIPTACSEEKIASGKNANFDPTGLCVSSPNQNGSPSQSSPGTGYCSKEYLTSFFGEDAEAASCICNAESGGNPDLINCGCLNGTSFDYSIGLFQINLLAHCDNGSPFDKNPPMCTIKNQERIVQCANTFFDPEENIKKAVSLANNLKSRNYSPWCPWINAAKACGLDVSNCP
jgi:hypothetical protein